MELRYVIFKKSRSYRKINVRKNLELDDEGMEQYNKGFSKKGKFLNDWKIRIDGLNEILKKRLMEDLIVILRKRLKNELKESLEEKLGGYLKDRLRRKLRLRLRDRLREYLSDILRKYYRKRLRERLKERLGKYLDEKLGIYFGERGERLRDRYRFESKSLGKEKVIEFYGNNSLNSFQKLREILKSIVVKKIL